MLGKLTIDGHVVFLLVNKDLDEAGADKAGLC